MTRDARQLLLLLIDKYNQTTESRINMKCEEMPKMIVHNRVGITEELAQEGCIVKDTISLNMVGDVEVDITSTGLHYFEDEKNNKPVPQSVTKSYNNCNIQEINGMDNTVIMNGNIDNLEEIKGLINDIIEKSQQNQDIVDFMEDIKDTIADCGITESRAQRWIRRLESFTNIGANIATCAPQLIALSNLLGDWVSK